MRVLDLTLPTLADNLALDEALLLQAEAETVNETLRFWEWPHSAVVLGSGCRLSEDVNETACQVDAVPIERRSSGGGTVLLGRGCLLYTLILNYDRAAELAEIRPSYQYILQRVGQALTGEARIETAGISDLTIAGRKFSGNAQQRKRHHLLHHGTLLTAFDLSRVGHYLHPPPRQPEYRAGRAHAAFLRNLSLPIEELKRRLRGAWRADTEETSWPEAWVRRLVAEKYATRAWIRRR